MLTYPSARPQNVPFVLFKFKASSGGSGQTENDIAIFMPPAFQISEGQNYEFAQKSKYSRAASIVGDLLNVEFGSIMNTITDMIDPAATQEIAMARGLAARDPKFFNYKEPKPREFTFNYKFEPRNEIDANAMMAIIASFRRASYPSLKDTKNYVVPDSVLVAFQGVVTGLEDNIAECVIKDLNTTLSEGEQMMTFSSGIPTQVSLQITFAETIILTKADTGRWNTSQGGG